LERQGRLVEVEDPIPTVMTEDVNKEAHKRNLSTKGRNVWISPSTPDSSANKQAFSLPVPFASRPTIANSVAERVKRLY